MSSTMIHDAGTARMNGSLALRVPTLLSRFASIVAREVRIHRDMRLLASFNDASLRDIGLARGGMEDAVRNGRAREQLVVLEESTVEMADSVSVPHAFTEWR